MMYNDIVEREKVKADVKPTGPPETQDNTRTQDC